jgi:hypothetical protein
MSGSANSGEHFIARRRVLGTVGVAGLVLAIGLVASGVRVVGTHVLGRGVFLASLVTPDGAEYRLARRWNIPFEPNLHTVSFYMREPFGEWGWCYVGHEETDWKRFSLEYDAQSGNVRVLNADRLRGQLDCATKSFATFDDEGRYRHSVSAPQELRAAPGD